MDIKMKMGNTSTAGAMLAAALGVLSSYMMELMIPLIVMTAAMVVDYITGMAKAWNA